MLKRTSVATIIALFIVIAISGLSFDRTIYRNADGQPKEDYIDNFINDSLLAGNNFIGGISGAIGSVNDIFHFVGKLPIISQLVAKDEKDWSSVEVYDLDYRRIENRYLTDLDVLPPEEYVEVGDQLLVRIFCADYDIWHPHRSFYRIWEYGPEGYRTNYKCYERAMYKRDFLGVIGKQIRKVSTKRYLGIAPMGYVEYEKIEWMK
jgi:hypothetical protein